MASIQRLDSLGKIVLTTFPSTRVAPEWDSSYLSSAKSGAASFVRLEPRATERFERARETVQRRLDHGTCRIDHCTTKLPGKRKGDWNVGRLNFSDHQYSILI